MSKTLAGWALGLAIASFVIGFIPFVNFFDILLYPAALIVAIIAMVKCKTPEQGKGLAIAALIIVIAMLIILPIMLAAMGALAYFGVLSPDNMLPSKCVLSPPLSCTEFKATSDGVIIGLQNNAGVGLESASLTVSGDCSDTIDLGSMTNGQSQRITVCEGMGGRTGDNVRLDLAISYGKEGETITHETAGSLMAKIE